MKIIKGIQTFLSERNEADALQRQAQVLLTDLQEHTSEIFDTWSRNMLAGIRDESLR